MSDKTQLELEAEKEAVKAMRNAHSNMVKVLKRVDSLEDALKTFCRRADLLKRYLSEGYADKGSTVTIRQKFEQAIMQARLEL